MSHGFSPTSRALDANSPRSSFEPLPPRLERKIAARWKEWEPWVLLQVRRRPVYDPVAVAAETACLRQRHSNHITEFAQAGVAMRVIRRHHLDDPRITDEVRALLVKAARERQRTAWRARPDLPDPKVQWETGLRNRCLSMEAPATAAPDLPSQPGPPVTIAAIEQLVSECFYLRELRDPDLQLRSSRQIIAFPRQLAMYLARELTGATLAEIGRQFGGMHHTTVLHSINKIETLRLLDQDLDRSITRQVIEHGAVCQGPLGPGREAEKFDGAHLAYSPGKGKSISYRAD